MTNLVQAIIVEQNETTTHEDAVLAVALASLNTFRMEPEPDPAWAKWLSGQFTKTVRRMKSNQFERLRFMEGAEFEQSMFSSVHSVRAFSLRPMAMDDFPRIVQKAQVSGTDFPRINPDHDSIESVEDSARDNSVTIVVNDSLKMSTGKECAQAAHAYWIAWLNGIRDGNETGKGNQPPRILRVAANDFGLLKLDARHAVNDAGLTEFNHVVTTTALVM